MATVRVPSLQASGDTTIDPYLSHFVWAILTLTGIQLWAHICAHLNLELRECLITFPIFVPSQRFIARNVRELFSFNRGARI